MYAKTAMIENITVANHAMERRPTAHKRATTATLMAKARRWLTGALAKRIARGVGPKMSANMMTLATSTDTRVITWGQIFITLLWVDK